MLYFDAAAAAPVLLDTLRTMETESNDLAYVNQEAGHYAAFELRKRLRMAETRLVQALALNQEQPLSPLEELELSKVRVVWGNSGSELLAQLGMALARAPQRQDASSAGRLILRSPLEHPALLKMSERLNGVTQDIPIEKAGNVKLDLQEWHLPEASTPRVSLLALHQVQSEIGVFQDCPKVFRMARSAFPQALLLSDAIQSAGKFPLYELLKSCDVVAVSGHKFGAPGGAALLLCSDRGRELLAEFERLRHQEYLAGRPEPLSIFALTRAAEYWSTQRLRLHEQVSRWNHELRTAWSEIKLPLNGQRIRFTVAESQASPYILHLALPGYQSGVLVRMFAEQNIMLAAGSACMSETREPSATLCALQWSRNDAFSGLRISFSHATRETEVAALSAALPQILKKY